METSRVAGDATRPQESGPRAIVHVCNDIGGWGRGFVLAVSRRWPESERAYRAWSRGPGDVPFALGQVQFVPVDDRLWVATVIGQHDIRPLGGAPPIRYPAVRA